MLPFPYRHRKPSSDEQFGKFVELIKKLYVNIPLLDAMQVPTYAKYLRDILLNERLIPDSEVIKMTEECSAAILNAAPPRRKSQAAPPSCAPPDHKDLSKHSATSVQASASCLKWYLTNSYL